MRAALRVLSNGYDYLVLYLGLVWLGVLCLAWTPIAIIVYPLLSERRGRALGRYVIMAVFRVYIASLSASRRFSFDLEALDVLRDEPSLIIAPNHPSMLDAVMVMSRLPNVACVLKTDLMNNIFLGAGSRLARYIRNEPVRRMVQLAIQDFACGSPCRSIIGCAWASALIHRSIPGASCLSWNTTLHMSWSKARRFTRPIPCPSGLSVRRILYRVRRNDRRLGHPSRPHPQL